MPPEMLSELLCRAAENKFGHRAVSSIVRNLEIIWLLCIYSHFKGVSVML